MKRILTVFTIAAFLGLTACAGGEKKEANTETEAEEMMDEMDAEMEEVTEEVEVVVDSAATEMEEATEEMEAATDSAATDM